MINSLQYTYSIICSKQSSHTYDIFEINSSIITIKCKFCKLEIDIKDLPYMKIISVDINGYESYDYHTSYYDKAEDYKSYKEYLKKEINIPSCEEHIKVMSNIAKEIYNITLQITHISNNKFNHNFDTQIYSKLDFDMFSLQYTKIECKICNADFFIYLAPFTAEIVIKFLNREIYRNNIYNISKNIDNINIISCNEYMIKNILE